MAEEVPERGAKFGKRERKISHPLVIRVLSKISESQQKKEKETTQEEAPLETETALPGETTASLRQRANLVVKIFSILVVLFLSGWYIFTKSFPLKALLGEHFSILGRDIVTEKDRVWIRKKIPQRLKAKVDSFKQAGIKKDVKGIPIYMGATNIKVSNQDNVSTLNFTTSDPIDRVANFYMREMEKKGYGLVRADYWPGANVGQLLFSREGKECNINLVENEHGGVNVAISYIE